MAPAPCRRTPDPSTGTSADHEKNLLPQDAERRRAHRSAGLHADPVDLPARDGGAPDRGPAQWPERPVPLDGGHHEQLDHRRDARQRHRGA